MSDEALEQGSEAWKLARVGSLGASVLHEIGRLQTGKGYLATRKTRLVALAIERVTGKPVDIPVTFAMQNGKDLEPEARFEYGLRTDDPIEECGLFRHPHIIGTHASPDGLVGSEGMLEIKCPGMAAHMETVLSDNVPEKYRIQMQWQMVCAGEQRRWCDYVSYNPDFPPGLKIYVKRWDRDDNLIMGLEAEVAKFLGELDAMVHRILEKRNQNGES